VVCVNDNFRTLLSAFRQILTRRNYLRMIIILIFSIFRHEFGIFKESGQGQGGIIGESLMALHQCAPNRRIFLFQNEKRFQNLH